MMLVVPTSNAHCTRTRSEVTPRMWKAIKWHCLSVSEVDDEHFWEKGITTFECCWRNIVNFVDMGIDMGLDMDLDMDV